jgi:uncharacterized protein (TIGR01777 family)
MKILMTGGTGLVGCEVGLLLSKLGHEVHVVSRNSRSALLKLTYKAKVIEHDLGKQPLDEKYFNGVDVIINLAGESVDGRWTEDKKRLIRDSRIKTTQNLLLNCPTHVGLLISASAQGFYGDCGDIELDEDAAQGNGFLAEVCNDWESENNKFKGKRKVIFRIGLVLSKKGGALPKLVSLFRKNLGAQLGNGKQWMSWISLQDLANYFLETINNQKVTGVINAVNGHPITNADFTKTLCRSISAIQIPSAPAFSVKTLFGEMSSLVLSSQKVISKKTKLFGLECYFSDLELFLKKELSFCSEGESYYFAEQFVPNDINEVFTFFSDPHNLEKITPNFLNFKILSMNTAVIQKGTLIDYKLKIHGVPLKWRTEIANWEPPYEFCDIQLKGPYSLWKHEHFFETVPGGTLLTDLVRYKMPLGGFGNMIAGISVENDIKNIFQFRRSALLDLIS